MLCESVLYLVLLVIVGGCWQRDLSKGYFLDHCFGFLLFLVLFYGGFSSGFWPGHVWWVLSAVWLL